MSRKIKAVKLDDREVIIYELLTRDVSDLIPMWGELSESFSPEKVLKLSQTLLQKCTNLTLKEAGDLSFSEVDKLEAAFKEVNEPFLRRFSQGVNLAKTCGIERLLISIKEWIIEKAERRLNLDLSIKETTPPGLKEVPKEVQLSPNVA